MYDEYDMDSGEFSDGNDIDVDVETPDSGDMIDTSEIDDGFYHARPNDEIFTLDEAGDLRSIADMQDELENGDTVEPYRAIPNDQRDWEFEDLDDSSAEIDSNADLEEDLPELTPEEEFEKSIEDMSLEELRAERDRLEQLSSMSDDDVLAEYEQDVPNGSSDFLDSLSREQLEFAKQQLEQGNTDIESLFGFNGDVDDEDSDNGYARVLRR